MRAHWRAVVLRMLCLGGAFVELVEKLTILGDAAKFDVSCSSSGTSRTGDKGTLGSAAAGGICHTWSADGRCVSLLKVLMTNVCVYDCAYCQNRASLDKPRATFTPQELADLTIDFYRRNYIEGLFLSSGVLVDANTTSERMLRVLEILRIDYRFAGYIHVKIIPGTDNLLIERLGSLADRVSCNIELPSSGSLERLAPQKLPSHILAPMRYIQQGHQRFLEDGRRSVRAPQFAPAGQTTQMIIGATPDTDHTILSLSKRLYSTYKLKRVYFSAFIPGGTHAALPPAGSPVPLVREHRLYQADWLMRFYHFDADELLETTRPTLSLDVDPKCDWALRHPEYFPVEVNAAPLETLLRIPGVGVTSAQRIVAARRQGTIALEHLRKLGIVMKRAQFFLTANGKFAGTLQPGHALLRSHLADGTGISQLSLFDTPEQRALEASVRTPLLAVPRARLGS